MKNIKMISRIVSTLLIVFMLVSVVTPVFAVGGDPLKYNGSGANVNTSKIDSLGQNIISIVATVGSIVSVVVLVVLGIKYMMGSAEEKAEYKKTLMPYVIGAALVFAASTIAQIVYNFMQQV